MDVTDRELAVINALSGGLDLCEMPYARLGLAVGLDETQVIAILADLRARGVIRRLGVIVRHHELGYRANAMVVWDIPDAEVAAVGRLLGQCPEVTLCYRRPRRMPDWPYNLFTMVHGKDRAAVEAAIQTMAVREGVGHYPRQALFSLRRFKQCGARYGARPQAAE